MRTNVTLKKQIVEPPLGCKSDRRWRHGTVHGYGGLWKPNFIFGNKLYFWSHGAKSMLFKVNRRCSITYRL